MKRTPTGRTVFSLAVSSTLCLALVTVLRAQATPAQGGAQGPPAPTGPMAPEKYKDIQVLTDVPADQLDVTMRYFVAATRISVPAAASVMRRRTRSFSIATHAVSRPPVR